MTQSDLILSALLAGEALTPLECLRRFGSMDARKRISELRRAGHPIESRWITLSSGKRVREHFLNINGRDK